MFPLLQAENEIRRGPGTFQPWQVNRMLADPRAYALVDNFFSQWLRLRYVNELQPLEWLYPDFDNSLRLAFRRETELFTEHIVRSDRIVRRPDLRRRDDSKIEERGVSAHRLRPFRTRSKDARVAIS